MGIYQDPYLPPGCTDKDIDESAGEIVCKCRRGRPCAEHDDRDPPDPDDFPEPVDFDIYDRR